MQRLLLGSLIILCLVPAQSRGAEFVGKGAVAELPISARILDFNTTKKLCGSMDPPGWCPAHLLRDDTDTAADADTGESVGDFYSNESIDPFSRMNYSAVFE